MLIDIGLNTCCFTRRWEDPKSWAKLVKEAGFPYFQLDSDMLDPFFSGDRAYQLQTAATLKEQAAAYGVEPTMYYTGMASYRFHGIAHSDPSPRSQMRRWIEESMDITLAAGMYKLGGRFDAYSVETLKSPERFAQQLEQSIALYREISVVAKEKGIEELALEQMYVPSLYPWTIQQTTEYLQKLNQNNPGCRITTTVDVGHMASQGYGGQGDDLLYERWLEQFAPVSEDIHIQQTGRNKSSHDPFTAPCNEAGDIHIDSILEAIRWAHNHFQEQPVSEYLEPVARNILILEYIPSTTETEAQIMEKLQESCSYLRSYIPEGGLVL